MELFERSYTNGTFFRPKPAVLHKPDSGLLIVASAWGTADTGAQAAKIVQEQFEALSQEDLTSPFDVVTGVSTEANRLRVGLLLANQQILKSENSKTWRSAVEILAIHRGPRVLSWAAVGGTHLLMMNHEVHPLVYSMDWGAQSRQNGPLFVQALGLERSPAVQVGSVRWDEESRILLLARSSVGKALWDSQAASAEQVFQLLVDEEPEQPFWMGFLDPAV